MSVKNENNEQEQVEKDPFEDFVVESSHDKDETDSGEKKEAVVAEEADKDDADKEAAIDDKAGDKKPAKKTVEDRIAEITAKRRQAERDASAAEQRAEELERRLAALEAKKDSDSDQLTQGAGAAKKDPSAPDPEKFEYGEVDPRYVAALARYEAKLELAEQQRKNDETRQAEAAAAAQQELQQKLDNQIRKGVELHEDFEAALAALDEIETPVSDEASRLIVESEYGAQILYHFGKNPKEAAEAVSKSPLEQARIIGRLEAQFAAEAKAKEDPAKEKKTDVKVSKAPVPPETRVRGSNGQFRVAPDTDDFAAFDAAYN